MSEERNEEAAFGGLLNLTVGGQPVELRILTWEESDKWQRALGEAIGSLDVPEATTDGNLVLGNMLMAGPTAKFKLVLAYDVDGNLGTGVEKRITKQELYAAFESILDVEFPKEEAANRSVAEAFGRQSMMVQVGLAAVQQVVRSSLENGMSGRLLAGEPAPENSAPSSPANSSSSSGPTARNGSNGRHRSRASSPKSPAPTRTSTRP